ncbi:MAG TPA: adenylate/guanylate cyclase domain-containing protein [Solirubrobacterales bacterium]|nr:adenylate/guanylate cyclase domain-containing protein [Solirubrobacterales bacterium]
MDGEEYPHALPEDPVLAEAARALEDGRLAGEVLDADWRLRYVSSELRNLVGVHDDEGLGYGVISTIRAAKAPEVWRLSEQSAREWWLREGPYMRHDLDGIEGRIVPDLGRLAGPFDDLEPVEAPIAWAGSFETTFADASPVNVGRLAIRLVRSDGDLAGILALYVGGDLRGSVQAMLSRGDDRMFERMAALTEPARRPGVVLFCDLEESGVHSRRLPSKAYFEMIRELTTAIDEAVIDGGGIVGKHVGDGVSAFFLAAQCNGEAGAARGVIEAARRIQRVVAELKSESGPVQVNIGIHWGATLVIGQVVTGGRLEVTALGDEVNQAARIQEVCSGGRTLVSKDVLERLEPEAAAELGVDPDAIAYEILGEIEGAGEKARRDAGTVAVADLAPAP